MSVSSTYTAISTSLDVTRRSRSSRTWANVRRTSTSLPETSLLNVVHRFVGSGGISKPIPNHCRTARRRRRPQRRWPVQAVIVHNPDCQARARRLVSSPFCKSVWLSAANTFDQLSVRSLRHAHAGATSYSFTSAEALLTSSRRNIEPWQCSTCLNKWVCYITACIWTIFAQQEDREDPIIFSLAPLQLICTLVHFNLIQKKSEYSI